MKICDFTKPELDIFQDLCNFTNEELVLFKYRASNMPLEECAEKMDISVATVNRLSKKINRKVEKVIDLM